MNKKTLLIQQLNRKMLSYASLKQVANPPTGWIKAIRNALGMSMQQLGNKLSITKQSIQEIEQREKYGSITLKSLKEVAKAMDMQLVYGLVPNDGSLDALIDRKAKELARQIVMRTSNTMKLEDQQNSDQRIKNAIQERATAIKNEMPKILWD
ncbi:MAG: mobile mystery protein A [Chitinophagaceae bacterium]|nr:MAG: mobile mystery protein A [Chitinophagaceae bacterium]